MIGHLTSMDDSAGYEDGARIRLSACMGMKGLERE
jgi:hypothetical protein